MNLSLNALICLMLLFPLSLHAQSDLEKSRKIFNDGIEKIEAEYKNSRKKFNESYYRYLESLKSKLQKSGNLDGLLAADKELKRFQKEGFVPEESVAGALPEIATAQKNYHKGLAASRDDRSNSIVGFTTKYKQRLEGLIKQHTAAGEIDKALAVKKELNAVDHNEHYTSAKFEMALKESETAKVEPSPDQEPEPIIEQPEHRPGPVAGRVTVTMPVVIWNGHGDRVRLRSTRGGQGFAKLDSHKGNDIQRDGAILKGGRTTLDGAEDVLMHYCKDSNQLGIRMVFTAENLNQRGPARILSFSKNGHLRNFSVCQEADKIVLRLRTTHTGDNGTNPEVSLFKIAAGERTDLVLTYGADKGLQVFKNGEKQDVQQIKGDFSNWDHYTFVLGNEAEDDRPWKGVIHEFMIGNSANVRPLDGLRNRVRPAGPRVVR